MTSKKTFYNGSMYVDQYQDFPEDDHYAIIEFTTMWIPGDHRSQTNPGHGYPERNENMVKYIVFENREEWEREITKRMTPGEYKPTNKFVPIVVKRGKIKTTISVETDV